MLFALLAALLAMVIERWRKDRQDVALARLLVVAGSGVGALAIGLAGVLLVSAGGGSARALLPPLERALTVGWIAIVVWAMVEQPNRFAQLALLFGLLALAVLYLFQSGAWATVAQTQGFNLSPFALIWIVLALLLVLMGVGLLVLRAQQVRDLPLKLALMAALGAGQVGTLVILAQGTLTGDAAGLVRLSVLVAVGLVLAIAYAVIVWHLVVPAAAPAPEIPVAPALTRPPIMTMPAPASSADRESAQLMRALGLMLENANPRSLPERVTEAILTVMKADIAVMLRVRSASHAEIVWGRDRVMEKMIAPNAISLDEQPTLVNAIERRNQRPLFPDRNIEELRELYSRFDMESVGPTYLQPLVNGSDMPAVLVVGLPYTRRELSDSERELLRGAAIIGAKLLTLSESAVEPSVAAEAVGATDGRIAGLNAELEGARGQVNSLTSQVEQLYAELHRERDRISATLADTDDEISQQLVAVTGEEQALIGERDRLAQRARAAEAMLIGVVSTEPEMMLRQLIESQNQELADLVAERDRLQGQIDTLRVAAPVPTVVHDMLTRMSREKAALERDRQTYKEKLNTLEDQLFALGVTDGANGLSLLIQGLYEQRAALQVNFEQLKAERDQLLEERERGSSASVMDEEREKLLKGLQVQVSYLAADRESALRQRERFRGERDELAQTLATANERIDRLLSELSVFRDEVDGLRSTATDQPQQQAEGVNGSALGTAWAETRRGANSAAVLGMVQELRTPLTSVMGYVDLLLSETAGMLGEMQRRFLARVASNTARLAQMLEDVARLVTIDSDEVVYISERVNPVEVIEAAVTTAAPHLRERSTVLILDLADTPPLIRGDRDAIQQIAAQLLANAYLASPHGGEMRISAQAGGPGSRAEGFFVLAVSDQGGGIAPEDMPRIFARRYRADSPLIQGVGDTGVGLAIAKALTEAHGGRIWAESQAGQGTTFYVALPIDQAGSPELMAPSAG